MPTRPYYGQVINTKDFGGYSSVGNITLTYTNSYTLDGFTNVVINKKL